MYNPYILVPLATWAVAQLTKFVVSAAHGDLDLKKLYASGGMPSVHAAVTCSLATTALVLDGANSHIFGFTAVFAAVIMYDSLGVRRASGEQGAALNALIESLSRDKLYTQPIHKLREVLGHKPLEVGVGAAFGIVLALLFNLDHISPLTKFLSATPVQYEQYVYAVVAAILVLGGIVTSILMSRRKSAVLSALAKRVMYGGLTAGVVLAILVIGGYENVAYLSWRLWIILVLVLTVVAAGYVGQWARKTLPAARAAEETTERLSKWLPKPKKKKAKKR